MLSLEALLILGLATVSHLIELGWEGWVLLQYMPPQGIVTMLFMILLDLIFPLHR